MNGKLERSTDCATAPWGAKNVVCYGEHQIIKHWFDTVRSDPALDTSPAHHSENKHQNEH